jgi:hypothetical protein
METLLSPLLGSIPGVPGAVPVGDVRTQQSQSERSEAVAPLVGALVRVARSREVPAGLVEHARVRGGGPVAGFVGPPVRRLGLVEIPSAG